MKAFAKDLKTIYTAADEEAARKQLESVTEKWSAQYPSAMNRWHENWDAISPIFKFSKEVRTAFYTTNAIESLNSCYRRLNKQRSVFPSSQHLWKPYIWELSRSQKSGQCQSGTGEKFVASWKSCTLTGCWYSNKSWNIKSKYTPRFSGRSWHTSLFLLLNKQRLNSRNRCQAASIIIEDLNLQKKFHTVERFRW